MNDTPSPSTSVPAGVSRRTLIGGAALTGAALAVGGTAVLGTRNAFAAAVSSEDFLRLSEFVTGGKSLTAGLAARYQAALARHDKAFDEAAAALQRHVAETKPGSIDELVAQPDLDPALRKTVTQIVSAWYLGVVGDDNGVELISYANALMYRPTEGAVVIPSYGGGPDSWGDKPQLSAAAAALGVPAASTDANNQKKGA
ncbi:sugar dehydrogenase complex small subunit [Xylophilus sp.]|uniref:sugar dehydrogenase complex small subunit n=1 Tax=Xylophilus sp. TaxID=2653893 RepID=UPI0013B8C55F|nr:sugar dehydrogenase complex small subunit [Xylophilus sp.]KAF1050203.1 MAG: Fructose dehydrogenase small subunit [Xylophilus sp.]